MRRDISLMFSPAHGSRAVIRRTGEPFTTIPTNQYDILHLSDGIKVVGEIGSSPDNMAAPLFSYVDEY